METDTNAAVLDSAASYIFVDEVQPVEPPEPKPVEEVKAAVIALPKVTLTISDLEDFNTVLSKGQGIFGYKSLLVHWQKLKHHVDLAQHFYSSCKNKVARLNGDRTPLQRTGDKRRSLRNTAQQFYESLSTPMLRKQCGLFSVDYDSYEDQESIIAAIVEKHIEMSL